jgi:hypothetical protein
MGSDLVFQHARTRDRARLLRLPCIGAVILAEVPLVPPLTNLNLQFIIPSSASRRITASTGGDPLAWTREQERIKEIVMRNYIATAALAAAVTATPVVGFATTRQAAPAAAKKEA